MLCGTIIGYCKLLQGLVGDRRIGGEGGGLEFHEDGKVRTRLVQNSA